MPKVERAGDGATCPHSNTGSSDVFANSAGITRVQEDRAGGLIIGGGSQSVFVNGKRVSLPQDTILPHHCCPSDGCSSHCNAKTKAGEDCTVFAGTGYPTTSTTGPGGDPAYEDSPELELGSFSLDPNSVSANAGGNDLVPGTPGYVAHTYLSGTVQVNYTVQNNSLVAAPSFEVGLWEIDKSLAPYAPIVLIPGEQYFYTPTPILVATGLVGGISPLGSTMLSFTLENYDPNYWMIGTPLIPSHYYCLYLDLGMVIDEPNENNASEVATLTIL